MVDGDEKWWFDYIERYLDRARMQGVGTVQGRQALGKALVTTHSMLETSCLVNGAMPEPGVPSGEINEWETWHD